ncbi:MAG: hypothetical protein Q9166_006551 [cf. Caloplaca sp. 2 TL-2023]
MPSKRAAMRRKTAKKKLRTDSDGDSIASVAWTRDGATSIIDGDGFDSQIFTLIVGAEEKHFTAHASYLSQSPVFNRMCYGQFNESHSLQIRLPEDDPKIIKILIQYLYSGDFHTPEIAEAYCGTTVDASNQLAELFSVAEKYALEDLKTWIVKKLGDITDVEEKAGEFLSTAKNIYACTPDTDHPYRTFFKQNFKHMKKPPNMRDADTLIFDECISSGGSLAVDMVTVICSQNDEEHKK